MPMNQLDFDHPVERRGTASFKWDGAEAAFGRGDVIPLWVADMDFPCAPEILEAFEARIRHGVMGYTIRTPRYLEAVRGWFRSRHGWEVPEEHLAFAPPGVIFAVNVLIDILTKPGDRIVMQTPNYDALMSSVTEGGRILAENPLKVENGRYTLDFDGLERELARPGTKVLLMSNPNNPTGRLWTPEELRRLGEMCLAHGVTILSDDIHADLAMPGYRYTPLPSLSPKLARASVLLASTNKTFNLGGLQMATLAIGDEELRMRFNQAMCRYQTRLDNLFGAVALETAYEKCGYWLDQAVAYIDGNRRALEKFAEEHLPQLKFCPMEATYFSWVDFSGLGKGEGLESVLVEECGVALTPGREFSEQYSQFMRVNLACRRELLLQAFRQIARRI